MRALIVSGKNGIKRIEVEADSDWQLYERAVAGDVEAHNSLHEIEDHWQWGEEGTTSDPRLTDEDRARLIVEAEISRKDTLTQEQQLAELSAIENSIAAEADRLQRIALIKGQSFDAQAYYTEKVTEVRLLYTKLS